MTETIPGRIPCKHDYTIRRKADGLYTRGGSGPKWGKTPKLWALAHFKNHIHMFQISEWYFASEFDYYGRPLIPVETLKWKLLNNKFPYFDCEILKIDHATLGVIERFEAHEFAWNEIIRPFYMKSRYWSDIEKFAEKHKLDIS